MESGFRRVEVMELQWRKHCVNWNNTPQEHPSPRRLEKFSRIAPTRDLKHPICVELIGDIERRAQSRNNEERKDQRAFDQTAARNRQHKIRIWPQDKQG